MQILQDIKTAVAVFSKVREAQKSGASAVQVKPVYTVPVVRFGYWGFTMEGCLFYGEKWKPVRDAFDTLDEKTQHSLTFTPQEPGEWVERVQLWRDLLRPALPPGLYHEAMLKVIHWYVHCVRQRMGEAA